jgi:outer membrane lipoprotein-sorting protein
VRYAPPAVARWGALVGVKCAPNGTLFLSRFPRIYFFPMAAILRVFLVSPFFFLLAASQASADEAILNKARAYIGAEADLAAVHALLFKGDLTVTDSQGGPPVAAKLEIAFKKPDRQIITATAVDKIETTALNGYEAWQKEVDLTSPASAPRIGLLGREPIKRLRANTFENLSFYRGIECVGGRIEQRGISKIDGIECVKVAFIHSPDVVFVRSFDKTTGRMVQTETDSGGTIREEGEIVAGGLRFPKRTITTNTLPGGVVRTIVINFSEIVVNPELSDSLFATPAPTP